MTNTENFYSQYRLRALFVFGVILVVLFNRWTAHALLYAMHGPLFLFEDKEIIYHLLLASHLPQYITANTFSAALFDIFLFLTPVLFLITQRQIFAILFTVLFCFYFFTYNLVTGHHYHGLVGVIAISIPFWSKNQERFNLLWDAARFYCLYIFGSAALWKILRGSVFYTGQLSNILKAQQLDLILQRPDSLQSTIAQYLIANPEMGHWILMINVLVQMSFLIGFITKKFDALLFALVIIFCVANYFVMSIVSAELLILNLTLLNWKFIEGLFTKAKS